MPGQRTVIQVILFVTVSTYIPTGEGVMSSCTATNDGTAGRVRCSFNVDVEKKKQSFIIQRYDLEDGGPPEDVLTCGWTSAAGRKCIALSTYQLDTNMSSEIELDIPKITKRHEGMYLCLVVPSTDDYSGVCEMRINQRNPELPKSTTTVSAREVPQIVDGNETNHLFLVIGLLSGVLATAIAVVVILLRKTRPRNAKNLGNGESGQTLLHPA